MRTHILMAAVFVAGACTGWLGKTWFKSGQLETIARNADKGQMTATDSGDEAQLASASGIAQSKGTSPATEVLLESSVESGQQQSSVISSSTTVVESFRGFLNDRRYRDAMTLYQEQKQRSEQTAALLKPILTDQLDLLMESGNNSEFSELIENYLSIYYDDIDVLMQLADFNHRNNSYLEVINIYLLAKTYAYSDFDQKKVDARFNKFVQELDNTYTNQKNWWALINFYAHIDTSGLMTSTLQYQQALAHLRSGDEVFAIEQFNELSNDSVVGKLAAQALNNLASTTETPVVITSDVWQGADSIALEKRRNQYLVNLTNNRQSSVKLLIDTGASMTALSTSAFNSLNTYGDAKVQERRVFRTASGVVMATVYTFPELSLGPYQLKDTQIAVIDVDAYRNFDGLLGMNILGKFRFQIDQENSRLLLSREP